MQDARFVHLHVHTHYSMLDGACKVPELVQRAKTLGMDALAISDHGVLYGAIEFYNECVKAGVKPIVGIEAYMAPGDRRERSAPGSNAGEAAYHLLLLARDAEGYRNLIKLSSISYREGFYYKPRIDKEVLRAHRAGLICTSACLGGEVAGALLRRDMKAARAVAETYLDIFGPDRFFIEMQKHNPEQDAVNPELAALAKRLGVGLVGTNDVHFLTAEDHESHNCLCCISTGRQAGDADRLIYPKALYLKSPTEMGEALQEFPEAVDNTLRIAAMCDLALDFSKRYAPVYRVPKDLPEGDDPDAKADERYLRALCEKGLEWRYGTRDAPPQVRARLQHELKIIALKQFCSYFLIVWDFCNFAREQGIPVGARGSGVGTMVGYLLGLCNVDPLRFGLLFERFMDPSRNEMPDIDIDICQDGRQKVIDYVRQKYGHVAQIVTFGTLAAKAACKDVGRVLGVPLGEIDKLTRLIPGAPGMTLDKALAQVPELKALVGSDPRLADVVRIGKRLEGLCRNAGVHAAGVIIADQPLDELIPLCKDKDGNVLTQYEGPIAEKCGLLKMDFLGLRTLSVLQRSIDLVKQTTGAAIDIEAIDFADRATLELFCRGETRGIFQFESGGMQDLLMKMRPDRLEDLIAANALYRPGPMELIPLYCNRKHGREPVPSVHPIMDGILAETYGIMTYQEQVMQIFNQLGGIELSAAYKLIKAISKKQSEVIARYKPDFLRGAVQRGVSKPKAEELFELILKFGGYGFNKSHSTRYAIVAFQTGWMKAHYPLQYMAALLTYEAGSTDKVVEYIEECRRMGLRVLPPDVNESNKDFTPVFAPPPARRRAARVAEPDAPQGVIRFGLTAVRGVGEKAVDAIIDERARGGRFRGLFDLCERVDLRVVQRVTLEALARCGALASLGGRRSQYLHMLDRAVEMGQQLQDDRRSGQLNMFAAPDVAAPRGPSADVLPELDELPGSELLSHEKELLGFYITSHPLSERRDLIEQFSACTTRGAMTRGEGSEVILGAMVAQVRTRIAKSGRSAGQRWAIVELEDLEGKIEGILFAEAYAAIVEKQPQLLKPEQIVFARGKVDRKREVPCLVLSELIAPEDAVAKMSEAVLVRLDGAAPAGPMRALAGAFAAHKGGLKVFAQVTLPDERRVIVQMPDAVRVRASTQLRDAIEAVAGAGSVHFRGPGGRRAAEQRRLFREAPEPTEPADAPADLAEEQALAAGYDA